MAFYGMVNKSYTGIESKTGMMLGSCKAQTKK